MPSLLDATSPKRPCRRGTLRQLSRRRAHPSRSFPPDRSEWTTLKPPVSIQGTYAQKRAGNRHPALPVYYKRFFSTFLLQKLDISPALSYELITQYRVINKGRGDLVMKARLILLAYSLLLVAAVAGASAAAAVGGH